MQAKLSLVVRSTEIDVNGHVNNAKYLEYLEWGREEWYEQAKLPYEAFLQLGIQTVTVNININYRRECRQGDQLTVITQADKAGRSSYVLRQEIVNARGEVCADALVTSVTMDSDTRKSKPMPERLRTLFPEVDAN
ncbi:acyl-CoA thioesterase [Paenibacillus phyllosphaerae]|uniref:acyl-CoA thioesterase n=1 Tax=Paenibacillus phyllosphaerae TaxID=274593 RepID=UPI0016146C25|nr:acyl-CoA thioesterase [Paenibacillus phyllosphaerae]